MPRAGARSVPKPRHLGLPDKSHCLERGRFAAQRRTSLLTTTDRGHVPSWLSLRVCGCSERACPAPGRSGPKPRRLGLPDKSHCLERGRFAAQRRTSLLTTTDRGHVPSWLSLRECGCGERACPALGREAAPNPGTSVYQINHIVWSGAASQPSAGQARSPPQVLSPQPNQRSRTTLNPIQSPRVCG